MTSDNLLKLRVGQRLIHSPTGNPAVVQREALASRRHGFRVTIKGAFSTTYLTPSNIKDWTLG